MRGEDRWELRMTLKYKVIDELDELVQWMVAGGIGGSMGER